MNATLSKTENQTAARNGSGEANRVTYLTPPANIREDKDGYILEAEMPGVSKDGLEVTIENGELQIIGRRTKSEAAGRQIYRESRGLDYRRVFELDHSIDAGKIVARIDQGVLTLHLPKSEAVKPRKIEVTD